MVRRYTAHTPRVKGLPLAESWYPFREPRPGYNRSDFELRLRKPFVEKERMSERYDREDELGMSWASVVFGWLAALGASLILSGIVGAVVGAIFAVLGFRGGTEGRITSLVGLLITFFLSFLVGGYVAGCMAGRSDTKHGLLVALLALVVTIVLALLGAAVATPLVNILGVTFSNVPKNLPSDVPGLGIVLSVSGVLVLIFMVVGGALGGQRGASTARQRP